MKLPLGEFTTMLPLMKMDKLNEVNAAEKYILVTESRKFYEMRETNTHLFKKLRNNRPIAAVVQ